MVKKRSTSLLLSLFLAAPPLTTGCSRAPQAEAGGPPPLPVKVQAVESGTIQESSEFVGTLEAQERVELKPEIQGRIEQIEVAAGDRVQAGTPILLLRPDQTQAQLENARARTSATRAARTTAAAQLQAREADRARLAAEVELQRTEFNRTSQLVAEGAFSQQQQDIAQKNLDTAIASLQAAEDQVAAAQAAVAEAEANIQAAAAEVASVQETLGFKQVTAPIAGIVGDVLVKAGDYVSIGQTVTNITQNDFLDLRISVPSTRTNQLRPGLPVELIDPNTEETLTTGSVDFISPQVNTAAQTILIKARFPNQNDRLRDGQFVRGKIIWETKPGLLVPTVAVSRIGGQSFVFVSETDDSQEQSQPIARQVPVELGNIQGPNYEVLSGLESGDQIAVSNILKLRDGAPIQPES
jgi:RND family efflux transporter MFP subunit